MFSALIFSLATAMAPPTVALTCQRDEAGACLPIELAPPVRLLRAEEVQAAVIYRPYWDCYWNALSDNAAFGSTDGERAKQAFTEVNRSCAHDRTSADRKLDGLLHPLALYGNDARKRFLRNQFRRDAGQAYLEAKASTNGRRAPYAKMLAAYQEFEMAQVETAPGR